MNPDLISRQYKLSQIARFMEAKEANPTLKQKELARLLDVSESTIKRTRKDLNMKSPYRYDISLPKKTSKPDTKATSTDLNKNNKKIDDEYLDRIIHNK